MEKSIIYISGLPRSGATLLCQLLAQHDDVFSSGLSSPLAMMLNQTRHNVSDNEFLLSQLDVNFDAAYTQLLGAYRGLVNGWFSVTEKPFVVDKNRFWIRMVEALQEIDPDFKMVVCIRDIKQIIGSIEHQHRKTRLLDFPDHMDPHSALNRAEKLLSENGVIGAPLSAIRQMRDVENDEIKRRICYVVFESLIDQPKRTLDSIFEFLGLPEQSIDFNNLKMLKHESDSYYRFKYPHETFELIKEPITHKLPQSVTQRIENDFGWFYKEFYAAKEDATSKDAATEIIAHNP